MTSHSCSRFLTQPVNRRKLITAYVLEYVRPMEEGIRRCEPKNRIVATLQNLFLTQDPFQATIEDEVMNTEGLNT